jgi:hypothetical protein
LLNITIVMSTLPPHRVEDVVAPDRQRVAVAGDDPDHQLRARGLQAGGERRRAAVDRVEAVRVHVVRQPAGAADAADEDDVLLRHAEVGHLLLGLGEDRVVAAAGAPATSWSDTKSFRVSWMISAFSGLSGGCAGTPAPLVVSVMSVSVGHAEDPLAWATISAIVNGLPGRGCSPRRRSGTGPGSASTAGRG